MSDGIERIGRYEIEREIGRGGMAVVYQARDPWLERTVALKLIRKGAFPPEQLALMMERFRREARALAKLNHANIVKVMDYGEYKGAPYLVMEYIDGTTLKSVKKPLQVDTAVRLIRPIAEALEYVHGQGLLHRDVKPSNIMLAKDRRVILTDFGIAKWIENGETQATLTGTGIGIGTPEYMAPEQGRGQRVDGRTDLYALTVVFYELVTGRKPFRGDTPVEVLLKQANDPIPDPRKINPNLPVSAMRFFDRAMAKNPAGRYATIKDYLRDLDSLRLQSLPNANGFADDIRILGPTPSGSGRSLKFSRTDSRSSRKSHFSGRSRSKPRPTGQRWRERKLIAIAVCVFFAFVLFVMTLKRSSDAPAPTLTAQPDASDTIAGAGAEAVGIVVLPTESDPDLVVSTLMPVAVETARPAIGPTSRPYSNLKSGDRILFGRYEQDNNLSNGPEPIEWTTLEISGGTALLLSRFVLDEKKYDEYQDRQDADISWESSDIRAWLNGDFYETAFNGSEKSFIQPVRINRNDQLKLVDNPGTDRDNYVFLLNWAELAYYVGLRVMDAAHPTAYTVSRGIHLSNDGFSDWWLRSTDFSRSYQVGGVCTIDKFSHSGVSLSEKTCGVRPVIKLRMTDEITTVSSEASALSDLLIGDLVQFGSLEQDGNSANGPEPIDWQVLDLTDGYALLLSKYLLARGSMDESCEPYTWKQSMLRNWLNGPFYSEVFSDLEKSRIRLARLDNWDKTLPGSKSDFETDDYVFLLSPSEFENLVKGDFRFGRLAPALQREYDFIGPDPAEWWLRPLGTVLSGSNHVFSDGSVVNQCFSYCCEGFYFVRPAIRISLEPVHP